MFMRKIVIVAALAAAGCCAHAAQPEMNEAPSNVSLAKLLMAEAGFDASLTRFDVRRKEDAPRYMVVSGTVIVGEDEKAWLVAHELGHAHLWNTAGEGRWSKALASAWIACRRSSDLFGGRLLDVVYADAASALAGGTKWFKEMETTRADRRLDDPFPHSLLAGMPPPHVRPGAGNPDAVAKAAEVWCQTQSKALDAEERATAEYTQGRDDASLQKIFGARAHTRMPDALLRKGWRGNKVETLSFRLGEGHLVSYGALYLGCLDAAHSGVAPEWRRAAITAGLTDEWEADRLMCSALAGSLARNAYWDLPFEVAGAFGADVLAAHAGRVLAAGGSADDVAEAAAASKNGLAGIAEKVNFYSVPVALN